MADMETVPFYHMPTLCYGKNTQSDFSYNENPLQMTNSLLTGKPELLVHHYRSVLHLCLPTLGKSRPGDMSLAHYSIISFSLPDSLHTTSP